jgi:hypothetical protein
MDSQTAAFDAPSVEPAEENAEFLSIEACQRLATPLRQQLAGLDYQIRATLLQRMAEIERPGDDELFLKASATVLMSIAVSLLEAAAERGKRPYDAATLRQCADDAAQWSATRKRARAVGDGR